MNFDILGLGFLFVALILMTALQAAAALGAMYVLHQDRPLPELLLRWGAIVVPAALGYPLASWIVGVDAHIPIVFTMALLSFPMILGLYHVKDHIEQTTYGPFDFTNFQRAPFNELLTRLFLIFAPPTFVLHILEFLFVGPRINYPHYRIYVGIALFVLETSAIAAGFVIFLALDIRRTILLTAVSAITYIGVLWFLLASHMLR